MQKYMKLREQHPTFTYKSYEWILDENKLRISFTYTIEPDIKFTPTLTINKVTQKQIDKVGSENIDNYIFNIGLAEMFSYWKATASPKIVVSAGKLNEAQISFWHKLLLNGMGEYFFVNQMEFTGKDFVNITSDSNKSHLRNSREEIEDKLRILIPIGGGKDSAVTLGLLNTKFDTGAFFVQPTQAALDTAEVSKIKDQIKVDRIIDPKLIELNVKGYLNGHVPISAFFAFLSILTADLFDYTHVAISNERSSNEGNTWYCDREINHQYSKTYEYESDFQQYTKEYLPENTPFYFSFLRPIFELQIAKIFAKMKDYHKVFRSCNRGQKTNEWCGVCSKCLFAYVILYPFIPTNKINEYFGKDLFADEDFWPIAQELLGISTKKPLECVGTHEETVAAFYLSINKYHQSKTELTPLLKHVQESVLDKEENLQTRTDNILKSWNDYNSIPEFLIEILKNHVQH